MNKIINTGLLACLLLLLMPACGEKEKEVVYPPNIIPRETFVEVLADFSLAEGAANMNILNVQVQKIDSVYAFDPLKENNVRQSQYDSTLKFYTQHPDLYKKVYEDVMIRLTAMQSKKTGKADTTKTN